MEAKGMESLKLQTLRWCKRRTDEDGPAKYILNLLLFGIAP